jgi:hypothetical protein
VKVTELDIDARSKARPEWDDVFAELKAGKTLLLSDIGVSSIIHAAKRAGVSVHTSKRENGYVVWLWEK